MFGRNKRGVPRSRTDLEHVRVDARRVKRLRTESDRAARYPVASRNAGKIVADTRIAAVEVRDIAGLLEDDVDRIKQRVGHPVVREDRSVDIGHGDDHARVAVEREPHLSACPLRCCHGALHDGVDLGCREPAGKRAGVRADEIADWRTAAVERSIDERAAGESRGGSRRCALEQLKSDRQSIGVESQLLIRPDERQPDAVDEDVLRIRQWIVRQRDDRRDAGVERTERAGDRGKLAELRIAGNAGNADRAEEFAGSGNALLDRADVEDAIERNAARVDRPVADFLRIRPVIGQRFSGDETGTAAGSIGGRARFRRAGEVTQTVRSISRAARTGSRSTTGSHRIRGWTARCRTARRPER